MMKKSIFFIAGLSSLMFFSCKENNENVEVEIPEANHTETIPSEGDPATVTARQGAFQMKGLNYGYNDLEPYMDGMTVETHYSKHHLGYCNNLNDAIKGTPMEAMSIEEILNGLDLTNSKLRNNAGGYYNHNIFWEVIGSEAGCRPTGKGAGLVHKDFGNFDKFKTPFSDRSKNLIGFGWTLLGYQKGRTLKITSNANQDKPVKSKSEIKG